MQHRISIRGLLLLVPLVWLSISGLAQENSLSTPEDTPLQFPAANLAVGGVPGNTNLIGPHFRVSAVAPSSYRGGIVSLINTQTWVARYNAGPNSSFNQASHLTVDGNDHIIVTGDSFLGLRNGVATLSYLANGSALWTNRYDDPPSSVYGLYLATDASNNVYVAGNEVVSPTQTDVIVIRYSPDGVASWTNRYNGTGNNIEQASGFAVDRAGNASIALQTFTFFGTPGYVTVKYAPSGQALWTNRYSASATSSDAAAAIAVDATGNLFVTGESSGFDVPSRIATLKYSPDGIPLWTNRFFPGTFYQGEAILVDGSGNVVVAGNSISTNITYFALKYSNGGEPLWTNLVAGPNYSGGNVPAIAVDPQGSIFVVGGAPGASASGDYIITKLSALGAVLWTNRFTGLDPTNGSLASIAAGLDGSLYLCGSWTAPGAGAREYLTAKIGSEGDLAWTHTYKSAADKDSFALWIAAAPSGNVYVTGSSENPDGTVDYVTLKYADEVTYTPPPGFTGTDAFSYTITDSFGNTATGTVVLTVGVAVLRFNVSPSVFGPGANGFHLRIDGASGPGPVIVFTSSDLINWQPISTNSPVNGSVQFTDATFNLNQVRFYKAIQPE